MTTEQSSDEHSGISGGLEVIDLTLQRLILNEAIRYTDKQLISSGRVTGDIGSHSHFAAQTFWRPVIRRESGRYVARTLHLRGIYDGISFNIPRERQTKKDKME
uniref:Uncharacterized protein n=1 Tax=Vespula pensylvanica TaxID=30213 RepID=A0A834NCY0_VESPE|nr:hypothetical protein H0235_015084 [Vespula pensylvanica]